MVNGRELRFGTRTRTVAAAHFLAAGLLLSVLAGWLLTGYRPGPAMDFLARLWAASAGESTVLTRGDALGLLRTSVVTAVALALGAIAAAQFVTAACTRRGRRFRLCLFAGLSGAFTVAAFPLVFVGVSLIYLSRSQFE
ncbi:hypothetical protein SAMN05216278_3373 [Halopelagius longus]|nr:hypothetical protein SAMN05216278_3373 [Halopelagius longus]